MLLLKTERLQKTQPVRKDVQKLILVCKVKLCCTTHPQDKLINLSTENATSATNAAQCFWLCGKLCTALNSAELGIQLG